MGTFWKNSQCYSRKRTKQNCSNSVLIQKCSQAHICLSLGPKSQNQQKFTIDTMLLYFFISPLFTSCGQFLFSFVSLITLCQLIAHTCSFLAFCYPVYLCPCVSFVFFSPVFQALCFCVCPRDQIRFSSLRNRNPWMEIYSIS